MGLSVIVFEDAINKLEQTLNYYEIEVAKGDEVIANEFRIAAIARFGTAFELGIKHLRRCLRDIELGCNMHSMSYRNLIRLAARCDFIDNPVAWFGYREKRDEAATRIFYTEYTTKLAATIIIAFVEDAKKLLERMKLFINQEEKGK